MAEAHRVQRPVGSDVFFEILGLQYLCNEVRVCYHNTLQCHETITDCTTLSGKLWHAAIYQLSMAPVLPTPGSRHFSKARRALLRRSGAATKWDGSMRSHVYVVLSRQRCLHTNSSILRVRDGSLVLYIGRGCLE